MHLCITGPESSGKSALSKSLALKYSYPLLEEYAREYFENKEYIYDQLDVIKIAEEQWYRFDKLTRNSHKSVSDTGVETSLIWFQVKYGLSDRITELFLQQHKKITAYILCKPDIPWEADRLRENPKDRHELFDLYLNLLKQYELPFCVVSGSELERITQVEEFLNEKA